MSLQIHLSAKNDELLANLRPRLAASRLGTVAEAAGIPRPIPVLLPSTQLGDWLQVQLARDLGLSMGFEFLQPAAFFKRQFAAGATGAEFAKAHAFWTPDRLRWHILPEIDLIASKLGLDAGNPFTPRDRFAFAQLLAQQFDRYARYRPDLPAHWDANRSAWKANGDELPESAHTDEAWQRKLWRSLSQSGAIPPHPARLLHSLRTESPVASNAPLFVVGTDRLDPLFLRTLAVLSEQGQAIELHLLLPSLGYLGDVSRRQRLLASGEQLNAETAIESGSHPLLASLGQQAVGTFLLLDTLTQDYAEWPANDFDELELPAVRPLLQRIQADIRHQRPPIATGADAASNDLRPRLESADLSLRIHCCHSARRELEVLRDELLRAFRDIPGLQPDEVMVAVTDFDAYAPLAQSILKSGPTPLPVRLTAIPAREANPITVALLELLRLSLGRQTASELVEILNLAAIQQRMDLADEPAVLAQLADAIRHTGLTHGLDSSDRTTADDTGTWRAALDRQLAGSWFGPEATARDRAGSFVHPLAGDLHHGDEARSRYMGWLTQLARHLRVWSKPTHAAGWAERLEAAVDDLLYSTETDDHAAATRRLIADLARVTAETPLDAGTMLDWLQPQLDNATSLHTSMGGEILLGRLDQIHGLPCRVLAILGLQDGAFPRAARRPAWDLLAYQPERFDSDPRIQDRQWFLDGLLAPKDRLILSAANRSLRTAHDGPLSAAIEELLRVAADTVRPTDGWATVAEQLVVQHRIQPFSSDYFSPGSKLPQSFDAAAAQIGADLIRPTADPVHPFYSTEGKSGVAPNEVQTITLVQLIQFWRDPAQAWLKALQLEIAEDDADDTDLDDAPVTLGALQTYAVRAEALATKLSPMGSAADFSRSKLAANRALPPGALGTLTWELQEREIETLAASLAPLKQQVAAKSIDVTAAPGVRLTGEVQFAHTSDGGPWVLCYRTSKFENNPKYRLEAFIHSLAVTVQLDQPVACYLLGLDLSTPKQIPGLSVEAAQRQLAALVRGYQDGQRQPLCFAPTTSHVLAEALAKGKDTESALESAKTKWSETGFGDAPSGEGLARAAQLAWRDRDPFKETQCSFWLFWSEQISAPLSQWWKGFDSSVASPAAPAKTSHKKA